MDMPGWSETFGYYSILKFKPKKHDILVNFNSFYNKSLAEMTMYPSDPAENLMFMYTWPDIRTLYNGVYVEDIYPLSNNNNIKISASLGSHINTVASYFGLQSLQIFYPTMSATKSRFLTSFGTKYNHTKTALEYSFGLAFSERAPSVSEGYGFYL
jgi:iron complex outermembrane receptor protein